jgi:hypothetical protein
MSESSRHLRVCARTAGLFLAAGLVLSPSSPAWAQAVHPIRWAGASDSGPEVIGAPDEASVGLPAGADVTVAKFDCGTLYAGLAAFLGVPAATVAAADVIAFEGNGGHPGESGGWESSKWSFTDGIRSAGVVLDAVAGTSTPPGIVLANGSVTGDAYRSYFGIPTSSGQTVFSFMLFDLPAAVDVDRPSFRVTVAAYPSGEGTPDPDAIGVLAQPCRCAKKVRSTCP